ncbi:hypothetical protein GFS60_02474 [Rhodococcus sp. WAY2]|nr:hypothetical protein GFS60_02474 [Rhodococcus sp. WAY2]
MRHRRRNCSMREMPTAGCEVRINNSRCRRLQACRQRSTPIHGGPGVQRLQTRRGL